jgi:hypothetical protein
MWGSLKRSIRVKPPFDAFEARLDPVKADGMLGELDGLLAQLHMDARKPCFEVAGAHGHLVELPVHTIKSLVLFRKPRTKKIKNLSLGHWALIR